MAEAVVAPLVGKLQEIVMSEGKALVAVNGDIRRLRDRLMWMQAFLQHADPRRRDIANELIGVWLKQTRDVAFDAEDALDHYFRRVDLSRYPTWTQAIIRFLAGLTTQVSVRHDLSIRIAEINSRLEDIIVNKEKYKVEIESNNKSVVLWKNSTIISTVATNLEIVPPTLIKRDDLENDLKNVLHIENNDRSVIYVTGKSGVGKATLVGGIYGTETSFDVKVWVTLPSLMNSSTVLQLINQQLDQRKQEGQGAPTESKRDILLPRKDIDKEVQMNLKGQKFLVVIDGDLKIADWNTILSALPDENKGSRVIRIVHGTHRATAAGNFDVQVEPFDEKEKEKALIKLFNQLFRMDEHSEDEEPIIDEIAEMEKKKEQNDREKNKGKNNDTEKTKKKIADSIWDVTGGIPLAVVLLSGLLKTREYPNEWQAIFDHLKSKQSKKLRSLLTTCFDDLPQDLKSCFLYFAAFPMNTPIEARVGTIVDGRRLLKAQRW